MTNRTKLPAREKVSINAIKVGDVIRAIGVEMRQAYSRRVRYYVLTLRSSDDQNVRVEAFAQSNRLERVISPAKIVETPAEAPAEPVAEPAFSLQSEPFQAGLFG